MTFISSFAFAQTTVRMSATTSGTDTYSTTFNPTVSTFNQSTVYVIPFGSANTSGTITIDPDTGGAGAAVSIKGSDGNDLDVGAIVAGGSYEFKFNGTVLRMMGAWEQGGGGHVIEEEGTPLTQRADLNFVGAGVTATDAGGKTVVTIPGGASAGGSDTQVQFNNSTAFAGDADFTFTGGNTLNVDVAIVDAEVYGAGWNGDNSVPTKNDTYDQVELKAALVNTSATITDASTMDITTIKNKLTTSSATRTFTISYTGDYSSIYLTLNTTSSTFTFPAGALCISEGTATGDNTLPLAGASGDKYEISIKNNESGAYTIICKNVGQ